LQRSKRAFGENLEKKEMELRDAEGVWVVGFDWFFRVYTGLRKRSGNKREGA
jgi:hypothetical protein